MFFAKTLSFRVNVLTAEFFCSHWLCNLSTKIAVLTDGKFCKYMKRLKKSAKKWTFFKYKYFADIIVLNL
jgi:hypothetical protein